MMTDTIKKLLRTFALIVMSLAVQTAWGAFVQPENLPTDSWANHRAQSFSSGSGTQADPWVITSSAELAFLAYQVTNNKSINGVACASAYYSLQADLNLKAHIWVPIGNLTTGDGKSFKGNFEGNGHVIKNMMLQWEVTNSTQAQAFGLFSTIQEKAVVKNLIIDNAYIYNKTTVTNPTKDRLVAPFAGALKQNTTIQNIIVKNTKIEVVDKYNQNGKWMIFGGFIAKMLDNSNKYNVSNIYVDTDIDITKMTVDKTEAVYSSLFIPEFFSNIKDAPKNIYLEGSILASAKLTLVGPVFGTNLPSSSTYKDTWQISNANTYQYTTTTDGETTRTNLTTKNAGGTSVSSFDASSFNTFSSENDLLSWTDEAGTPTLKKIVFPTLTKTRDESIRNNKDVVCTVSTEGIDGTISYEWVVDGKKQESNNTNTLTVTTTNNQRICSVRVTNTNGYDYTINFTVEPIYYSIDLYADNFEGGEGTADKPYIIKDDYQLAKLARDVNNGNKYSGIYFKLGDDINLDEALWLPISQWDNSDSKFGGKFDGDGHTISNMHLQWEAASGKWVNWGLFGSIKGTADKIENYASVTNLIIEDAVAGMKSSGTMTGQGLNVGIVSGEIYPYTEISNIILKGCRITDNEDVYSTTVGEHRIGGIVGNMEDESSNDFFRIFNITADTKVSAFVNATTNGKPIYISSGIGKSNFRSYTDAVRIFPKNIYLHGTAVITKPSTTSNLNSGTLFGKTMNLTPTAAQMETWNYAFDNATLKNKYGNYLEFTDDKAKTFQELLNKYITDNSLNDKLLWAYDSGNKYYFGNIELTGATETNYTVTAPEGTYDWYLSSDKVNWTKIVGGISEGTNSVEIPYQEYNQYVYAKSSTGVSKVLTVPALRIEAVTLNHVAGSKDYSVSIVNSIWKEDNSKLTITYNWYKNYDSSNNSNNILSTDSSYTHADTDPTTDQISCHIIVTYNGSEIANEWVGGSRIIYLCPAGVTIDGKTYAAGNDTNNDGLTPDKPKLTWQGAYAALSEEGSWDENKIVLMGTSSSDATFTNKGFAITDNLSGDGSTGKYDTWKKAVEDSKLNRNTTISGQHNGTDYKGVIEMRSNGQNGGLGIFGDTRFEHIAFKHIGGNYDILYCQYNNLEMGEGVVMKNYPNSPGYGTMDGSATMSFQIFGGLNNDNRFVPVSNKTVLQNMEKAMPHGREGFRITLKSGFYSCICAGGRQNDDNLNGIMGTPDMPVKCTIEMDIDREWNDKDNHNLLSTNTIVNYDAGIIMAGNHEGAMFGDVDIIIKSGYVGRVVNGTLGNVRNYKFTNNNKTYYFPNNTYMGRANILLDPASSRYSKEADTEEMVNARVVVTELYGGSCGRGFENNIIVDNPFYGISTVTIKGGTFKPIWPTNVSPENKAKTISGIFGAGAGGMTGLGNETHHTPDDRIPYWSGENLLYGDYSAAFANRAKYRCYNTDTHTFTDIDPYDTETSIVIEGGVFGAESDLTLFDGIYGGGSGYMATGLWTNTGAVPNKFGGNIYGSPGKTVSSLIINGGKFYCKNGIFAGGRGTEYYYEENSYGANGETVTIKNVSYNKPKASDYTALGQIYGNVEMTINGGNFHCPVFGGGYGVADAVCKDGTTGINTLSDMALITGQSRVNINGGTFYKNIYGGGDMARIENSSNDATMLSISDNANILGSVFAGGNGRKKGDNYTDGETLHPELVGKVTGNTNVNFYGTPTLAPKVYGDIFGGGNLAVVDGNTNVNIFAASFAGEVYGGGKGLLSNKGNVINSADVTGNTSVVLAQDQGGQEEGENGKLEDQFSINVIWDRLWDGTKLVDWTDATKDKFFTDKKFLNPHNIYGGGKYACVVGTYTKDAESNDVLTPGTGTATVSVRKGMTPFSLLKTDEWKQSYTDNKNPHFYVFGGGYGKHTKVGNTDVTVNVEGQYGIYNNEIDSNDEQLAKPRAWQPTGLSSVTEAQGEGSESSELSKVFDNSKGIPNFTILGVLGGGYAGTVSNDTKVTVDGNTFLHRVYGGGFGDPYASSADDKTGQVGGNTEVYVKGANIYGDVFGGGAGVASSTTADFVDVARVIGTTMVEVSDDARIYGNVYGGGDIANVGETAANPDYTSVPSSVTTLSQTDGSFIKHEASNFKAYVNILGGDIFGEVYAGGKGLTKDKAVDYSSLGRINGNTLLHIDNTESGLATIALDENDNNIPHIWNRIYGGCAYGTVDGNTLVHVEGGMLGNNIYGGGYGYLPLADDGLAYSEYLQVLGNRDTGKKATYANVLGNTKVQIDGGSWIWNRSADTDGNISVWVDANRQIVSDETEVKALVAEIKTASAKGVAELKTLLDGKGININSDFFDLSNKIFVKNHNIFGGGNQACLVGKYTDSESSDPTITPQANTGKAVVEINHSPLTAITTYDNGDVQTFNILDPTTLASVCWYLSINETEHPQFSVFGAGFGVNTKVGSTEVLAQPGSFLNSDGTELTVDEKTIRYRNQVADMTEYRNLNDAIYNDYNDPKKVSTEDKILYYGSADGTGNDPKTFLRYRSSRMAWAYGLSGFTFKNIHGGGYSGYVCGDTKVVADNQLACRNIFGGGLGAKPYSTTNTYADESTAYDFGSVSNTCVFIKSAIVSQDVFGGGAGIASVQNGETYIDFPHMARVKKGTQVHVYGETITVNDRQMDRTIIFGSVFGGGDAANVGTDVSSTAILSDTGTNDYASELNIRGGAIFSYIFAGGKGRLNSECADYKKLGGIYGNTHVIVDYPHADMSYPYEGKDPADDKYMKATSGITNPNARPHIFNRIYGGCQNGTVYGNTLVDVENGNIGYNIFGGGWGNILDDEDMTDAKRITSADVTGNANVFINGGNALLTSYWLPDARNWEPASIMGKKIYSPQYDPEIRKFKINHNIYGGGNLACVIGGNTYVTMTNGILNDSTRVIGNDNTPFFSTNEWMEVYNKVGSPHFAVFGGGYGDNTNVAQDTHINVNMEKYKDMENKPNITEGEEYKHFVSGYSVMDVVGGGYSGKVTGDSHVNVSGLFCRRIFGGGFYNAVNNTYVDIDMVDCHDIFGGGLMGDILNSTNIKIGKEGSGTNNHKDIYVHGSIYGANDVSGYVNIGLDEEGEFKDLGGSGTNIKIFGGHIDGNVYGAGNGDYLYALDSKGNEKVTVNEHYLLNPDDPSSEQFDLVYTVPMRETMPSYKSASDAAKIVNINSWRPLTNKVNIQIAGNSISDTVSIKGDVYGGGNSATVLKVNPSSGSGTDMVGSVSLNIGSHVKIGRVFMGCNGDALFTASEDNAFMTNFRKLNGDLTKVNGDLDLGKTIDWLTDPSNKGISTLYLPTKNDERPLVYPHLLDLYFQPVEMDIQGELLWNGTVDGTGLEDCIIGSFFCGGNRGNMNVYPKTDGEKKGNVFEYSFPNGLTITDKIVGGCNNANYIWKSGENKIYHEGGYLLGLAKSVYPFIKLNVNCKFSPTVVDGAYVGGNVYGGCYETGTIRGDITINLQSDMLAGINKALLDKSNELISSNPKFSALNVYAAGYGMESYVYGNPNVRVAHGLSCSEPVISETFGPSGTSANFIYGGGQQGNVIGVTNVEVFNGHIYKSVTGGSYSGYVWGSTQVKVGYPKYYEVLFGKTGRYILNRTDQANKDIKDETTGSPAIKDSVYLVTGDMVSEGVYNDIVAIDNGTRIDISDKSAYFKPIEAETPSVGWNNVHIKIGEAVYGGGYSLAHGASVMANNTTVLKFTDEYNLDNAFTTNEEHKAELASLPGGSTKNFGGNTTVLVADRVVMPGDADTNNNVDCDHITISHQEMKQVTDIQSGTDLQGYYYKDKNGNYRYIYMAGKYYYVLSDERTVDASKLPTDINTEDHNIYEYDNEGGIFGDGHLSYAQGFRSADLTGYGFASSSVDVPKILNTFQRMDILRLTDNCFTLLGARDYATNSTDKTPYSVSRVGEIQMFAKNVAFNDGKLYSGATSPITTKRARNYMGFANNIRYVGAINSNVAFTDPMYDNDGVKQTISYKENKQAFINGYFGTGEDKGKETKFEQRNNGTAKNMIGIASGYALKIQNVQELKKEGDVIEDKPFYGPIYGVIEMNLIDVREDEGGGYVYADNIHKRAPGEEEDFLETTGNFVFPALQEGRYIVDDCFPNGFEMSEAAGTGANRILKAENGTDTSANNDEIHYWYVTGYNYYYNAHITGYTSKGENTFKSSNDEIMVLSGMKPGQEVKVIGLTKQRTYDGYNCDLSIRNYKDGEKDQSGNAVKDKYTLKVLAPDDGKGFIATLPMDGTTAVTYTGETLPSTVYTSYPKILFTLEDKADNSTSAYYEDHLSKPYKATVILSAPAKTYELDGDGNPSKDESGNYKLKEVTEKLPLDGKVYTKQENGEYAEVETGTNITNDGTYYYRTGDFDLYQPITSLYTKTTEDDVVTWSDVSSANLGPDIYSEVVRNYTYTIDLTIEYVQGPDINGNITIENCALPGEMIRLKKDKVTIDADESFAANGYYWRIGKDFNASDKWTVDGTATAYDVYKVGDEKGTGLFAGCYYNTTEDYLDVPAYYFMNGYKVQLGISFNQLDGIFSAPMSKNDTLLIHNYHQMDPHVAGVNLHLPEALARANTEDGFAEPRIYLSDQQDIRAFQQFIDTVGSNMTSVKIGSVDAAVPRYGEKAQFVVQKDITLPDDYTAPTTFKGIIHGNGHVISGLSEKASFISDNQGQIYNLGLASGKIAASNTDGAGYHCCFEYKTAEGGPYVYRLDGYRYDGYSYDDFRYGKVAYDLNQYYLEARNKLADNNNLQYVKDYYANGDYQYAYRKDAITGNSTGIQYLRTGQGAAIYPNYGNYETRHDKTHAIDCPRAHGYTAAHEATQAEVDAKKAAVVGEMIPESMTGNYEPLFNAAKHSKETQVTNTELMNDYIFWGQDLQSLPDAYPSQIASSQVSDMTNRVYRAAAYYRDTNLSTFHYNAFKRDVTMMHSYVHIPSTTAIDFTCQNDKAAAVDFTDGIYYAPVKDIATDYSSLIITKDLSRNLLVYTPTDNAESITDIYDASRHLLYNENSKESEIQAHLVTIDKSNQASTQYLHLVERADVADDNNDFCAPIAFTVTDRTWYTRQPKAYAEASNSAWEGICLPFTVKKAEASVNGEITHFYGTAPENTSPADNHWNLHHEYWLRGMTEVNGTNAKFQRPGDGLFRGGGTTGVSYTFDNSFFVDTYGKNNYNSADNAYYSTSHTWNDYLPLTQSVPYIMSLPGKSYYEFDLTSEFYNRTNPSQPAQTVTFSADGPVSIPVTEDMKTSLVGYAHTGTFIAKETAQGSIYGINATGTAFEDAAATILPFRTYIEKTATPSPGAKPYSPYVSVINIAETRGMDVITPEGGGQADVQPDGNYILIAPAGRGRISVESTFDTTIKVFTPSGQLYRILDVRQGSATYSGFQSGLYIVGKVKVRVM